MSLLAAVAITTAATFGTPSADAATAWVGGFETGNLSQYSTNELPKSDSGVAMSSPAREDGKALRILLRRGDAPGRERAEVVPKAYTAYPSFQNTYNIGSEYWYSFSTYLPSNWVIDNDKRGLRSRADGRRYLSCDVSKQFEKYSTLGIIKRGGVDGLGVPDQVVVRVGRPTHQWRSAFFLPSAP